MSEITLVLQALGRGESNASEELFPLVYGQLRRLAAARMAEETEGQTLHFRRENVGLAGVLPFSMEFLRFCPNRSTPF